MVVYHYYTYAARLRIKLASPDPPLNGQGLHKKNKAVLNLEI